MRRLICVLTIALIVGASCGGDDDGTTASTTSSVSRAQARVDAAQSDVNDAEAAFNTARDAFCGDSAALIEVLDRYGRVLDDRAITVGDVRTGEADLTQARTSAGSSADAAIEARDQLAKANDDLTAALADLEAAKLADTSSSSAETPDTTETVTTATTAPPVPEDVVKRVEQAETDFTEAANGVDDNTALTDASVQLSSAAFAVQIAWMQLFLNAGCLTDEQRADAVAAVIEYTTALQTELQIAGYYTGKVDGIYGPETVAAVEALQEAAGLPVTGLVDGPTERALAAAVQAKGQSNAATTASHNAAIQGALKVLGYWDGPIDGQWSDELGAAITKLQTDLGIEPTGVVDAATLKALEEALAAIKTAATTPTTNEPSSPTSASDDTSP